MMASGTCIRARTSFSRSITASCSSYVPCEKLSLATFIPASIIFSIISVELEAGPRVQTIFVLSIGVPFSGTLSRHS